MKGLERFKQNYSKEAITSFLQDLEQGVADGHISGKEVFALAKVMETVAKEIKGNPEIREVAIGEVLNGDNSHRGVKLALMEAGTKYDFQDSPAWLHAKAEVDRATEVLKDVEALSKATKTVTFWVTPDGEQLEVRPAIKRSTTTIRATLPKKNI